MFSSFSCSQCSPFGLAGWVQGRMAYRADCARWLQNPHLVGMGGMCDWSYCKMDDAFKIYLIWVELGWHYQQTMHLLCMQLCMLLTQRWCQCLQGFPEQCIDSVISSNWKNKQMKQCIDSLICSKWKAPKEMAGVRPFPATWSIQFGFGSQIHLLSSFASFSSGGFTTKTTTSTAF